MSTNTFIDDTAQSEGSDEWKFENQIKLTPEELQAACEEDLTLKQTSYAQHEFVKLSTVTKLINE